MADLYRYNVEWSIPNAGPSVSVFHFNNGTLGELTSQITALHAFYNTCRAWLPDDVTVQFPAEASIIDEATGELTGLATFTPPTPLSGSVAGVWAGGAGWRVEWDTNTVAFGRRVRGATFFVPAASTAFATNGQVSASTRTPVAAAGNTFISAVAGTGASPMVYSRPRAATDDAPARSGVGHFINTASVPPLAATLRGRKY